MNNKMTFEYIAMVFVAALLATLATVPLKYAAAQNATMSQIEGAMTEDMIKAQIPQLKADHPVIAGILDKVLSMNATQTLGAMVALHALEHVLDAHARNILHLEPRHHV